MKSIALFIPVFKYKASNPVWFNRVQDAGRGLDSYSPLTTSGDKLRGNDGHLEGIGYLRRDKKYCRNIVRVERRKTIAL